MNSYAVVLGIAQDGGHPQPGCDRTCCRDTAGHLTTCVAVVDEGRAWLLDAGPDFRQHLRRLDGVELAGVLLTHGHVGHYTGLMYLGREAVNADHLPVWAAPRLAEFIAENGPWEQLVTAGNIDLRVLDPGGTVQLTPRVSVKSFPVPHRDEYSETVGYRVQGATRSLIYVPDTDSWDGWEPSVETHLRDCTAALIDATFFDATELPDRDIAAIAHPLVSDSLRRFAPLDDRERAKIHFTHLNHTNPLLNPASNEYIAVARAGMSVAAEGDVFEL